MRGVAFVLGLPEEVAGGLGIPRPQAPSRLLTSREDSPRASPLPWAYDLPTLTIVHEGSIVAKVELRARTHPAGLAGRAAEVVVSALGESDPGTWLTAALRVLEGYARKVERLETLLARPAADSAAISTELTRANYEGPTSDGGYVRELVSPFWRRGRVFIVAEAGSNWRMGTSSRDLAMARALIDVAADAGADAVKFQTFRPETVYVAEAGSSDYLSESGMTQSIRDIFADIAMPYEMLPRLAEHASQRGVAFMSTFFSADDFAAVDPYVSVHKIASYEITHIRLIELAARSRKPTVMSTGAASLDDIAWAVDHYHRAGGRDLCLMQCTAKYPTPPGALNVGVLPQLERAFGVPVGLSDHSRDPVAGPLAATALGARVIEKHFTLDNRLPGPDHPFALTPSELSALVGAVRAATIVTGNSPKQVIEEEAELAAYAQRGLQALTKILPGDVLGEDENVGILRPGKQPKGIHPRNIVRVAGKRATRELQSGEGLREGDWVDD